MTSIQDLFFDRVSFGSGCWEWQATLHRGYGRLRGILAHRIAWEIFRGLIPEGLCVLHKCDNPSCVKPSHLFLGTQLDNIKDRHAKGRSSSGESHSKSCRGEIVGTSKLKEQDVRDIRRKRKEGAKVATLSKEYGLVQSAIYAIIDRTRWGHIQ